MKGLKTGEKSEAEAASSKYDDAKEGAEQKTVEKEADAEDPANKAGEYVQIKAKEKAEKKAEEKANEQAEKVASMKENSTEYAIKADGILKTGIRVKEILQSPVR